MDTLVQVESSSAEVAEQFICASIEQGGSNHPNVYGMGNLRDAFLRIGLPFLR